MASALAETTPPKTSATAPPSLLNERGNLTEVGMRVLHVLRGWVDDLDDQACTDQAWEWIETNDPAVEEARAEIAAREQPWEPGLDLSPEGRIVYGQKVAALIANGSSVELAEAFAVMDMFGATTTVEQSRAWLPLPTTPSFGPDDVNFDREPPRPHFAVWVPILRSLLPGRLRSRESTSKPGSAEKASRGGDGGDPPREPDLTTRPRGRALRLAREEGV
jgi:hypothetical protein